MSKFYLETQPDGSLIFMNRYWETIRRYPSIEEARAHLETGGTTISNAYNDIGGFEMREVVVP